MPAWGFLLNCALLWHKRLARQPVAMLGHAAVHIDGGVSDWLTIGCCDMEGPAVDLVERERRTPRAIHVTKA